MTLSDIQKLQARLLYLERRIIEMEKWNKLLRHLEEEVWEE